MARHEHTSAGRGLGDRAKGNFGQEHKGSRSPFAGPSPMETSAPGQDRKPPRGPSLRGGRDLEVQEVVDRTSRGDVAKHGGKN